MICWSLIKSTSSQKTCARINISLFCRTLLNESTPRLVTRSSRLMMMKSFHSKSFRWTTKKLLFLMILFVKATKTASLIILSTGGTETAALFTSLKPSTRCRKTSVITAAIYCIFRFLPRENKRIADEIGVDHDTLDRATDKKYSFFYYDKPRK